MNPSVNSQVTATGKDAYNLKIIVVLTVEGLRKMRRRQLR